MRKPAVSRQLLFAMGGIATLVLGAAGAWWYTRMTIERQVTARFHSASTSMLSEISQHMELYLAVLRGGTGLYAASRSVERDEFENFFKTSWPQERYPGLLAVLFVERVGLQDQPAFVERVRADTTLTPAGYPAFAITPPSTAPEAFVVNYVEPDIADTHPLLGFDMTSEPIRRQAFERAWRTGETVATPRLILRAGTGRDPGFLLIEPVYRNGMPQVTVQQRQAALQGFIVAVIQADAFFRAVTGPTMRKHLIRDMKILDGDVITFEIDHGMVEIPEEAVLFDADPSRGESAVDYRRGLHTLLPLEVAGRTWTVYIATQTLTLDPFQYVLPWVILTAGLVVSGLMVAVLVSFSLSRSRAVRLAGHMTSELREKQRQLLSHEQALAAELAEHKRLKDDVSRKAEQLGQINTELMRREKITQSLLEDLQTSKQHLERQQRSLEEAHANLQRSHEEMLEVQLQLIQAEKLESIGRLAAGVAHEVKNPLAVILMGVTYLSRQMANGDPNVPMVLNEMDLAVRKADTVVRGLLDFSAPSHVQLHAEDLNVAIDQALALVKHEFQKSRVTVVRETAALPPVNLDSNKIQQVFVNLFVNAAHAMPNGGTLTIRTRAAPRAEIEERFGAKDAGRFARHESVVVVEVDDTGTGIPAEKLDRVFDPFFTTKPTGKGTGLGLTVTKKIVELHGGLIDLRNRPEGGVRATIVLA